MITEQAGNDIATALNRIGDAVEAANTTNFQIQNELRLIRRGLEQTHILQEAVDPVHPDALMAAREGK